MVVQHNMAAMNANRLLGITSKAQAGSTEKLSSGYRINRAGDDAAGLKISEKMRNQVRGLDQASANAQDGVSLIQTAEGALNESHAILQRMSELAVQGANDTNQTIDRESINEELKSLTDELDRISKTTQFNKRSLLDGSFVDKKLQVGANTGQKIGITIASMNAKAIGISKTVVAAQSGYLAAVNAGGYELKTSRYAATTAGSTALRGSVKALVSKNYELVTYSTGFMTVTSKAVGTSNIARGSAGALAACQLNIANIKAVGQQCFTGARVDNYQIANATMSKIQTAINNVSAQRSALGALQNRLEYTIKNLDNVSENTQAAESRIRDTDMASEMVTYSKNNILAQAGQSMLAQANQSTQGVLSLLG